MTLSFTIFNAPRTKKNSSRLDLRGARPRKLPSKAFEIWNQSAQVQLAILRAKTKGLPFTEPVNVRAIFWRHANVGDAAGFYQALADALQEGGVVKNDKLIEQWDGSRMFKSDIPRIEVEIETLR